MLMKNENRRMDERLNRTFGRRIRPVRDLALAATIGLMLAAGCRDSSAPTTTGTSNQTDPAGERAAAPAQSPRSTRSTGTTPTSTRTPQTLYDAVIADDVDLIKAYLERGDDPNEMGRDGDRGWFAPLHSAARTNRTDIMRLLIDAGADVNIRARASHRATPMHWAARTGAIEAVELLLNNGAEINALAGVNGDLTPMAAASNAGETEMVNYLAERGGRM